MRLFRSRQLSLIASQPKRYHMIKNVALLLRTFSSPIQPVLPSMIYRLYAPLGNSTNGTKYTRLSILHPMHPKTEPHPEALVWCSFSLTCSKAVQRPQCLLLCFVFLCTYTFTATSTKKFLKSQQNRIVKIYEEINM